MELRRRAPFLYCPCYTKLTHRLVRGLLGVFDHRTTNTRLYSQRGCYPTNIFDKYSPDIVEATDRFVNGFLKIHPIMSPAAFVSLVDECLEISGVQRTQASALVCAILAFHSHHHGDNYASTFGRLFLLTDVLLKDCPVGPSRTMAVYFMVRVYSNLLRKLFHSFFYRVFLVAILSSDLVWCSVSSD